MGTSSFLAVEDMRNEYRFARTALDGDGPLFVVEYRDGPHTPIYQGICPDPTVAHPALAGWTTDVAGRRDLAGWTQIELQRMGCPGSERHRCTSRVQCRQGV